MKNTTTTKTTNKKTTTIAPAIIAPIANGKRKYARTSDDVQTGTASLRYGSDIASALDKIQFSLGVNKSEAFILAVRQLAASL